MLVNTANVELKIIEAKSLKGLQPDPYVQVITRQAQQQTNHVKNNRNPNWNKSFDMTIVIGEEIRFEVWDYDRLGHNDLIGKTHYKFMGGQPGSSVDTWLGLDTKGEIHIQIEIKQLIVPTQPMMGAMPTQPVMGTVPISQPVMQPMMTTVPVAQPPGMMPVQPMMQPGMMVPPMQPMMQSGMMGAPMQPMMQPGMMGAPMQPMMSTVPIAQPPGMMGTPMQPGMGGYPQSMGGYPQGMMGTPMQPGMGGYPQGMGGYPPSYF